MTYVILGWVSVSIGFLLGAAWSGLYRKNNHYDEHHALRLDEMYSNTQQGE